MHTICAISTAPGIGGIAVVRVSGPEAINLVDSLFHGRKPLADARPNTVHFGEIISHGETIDQVLCSVFRAPHSFTGEDTVEIACHGSQYIQQTLLQALVETGCHMAGPGEFTQRAFLNGKMDLTEAEAVADLIAAQSKAEKDLALAHLKGGVSDELRTLREQLLTLTSLLELELDFADHEELEFADRGQLEELTQRVHSHLGALINSFRLGNAIKNGIPVAIVGPTNAGKSTLLNALLGEEKAIVSDIPGTTRDAIEDTLYIEGVQFRFIDTAGLRETSDTIENIGIQRSLSAARRAHLVLYVQDICRRQDVNAMMAAEYLPKKTIRVYNKLDSLPEGEQLPSDGICISARSGDLEPLKKAICHEVGLHQVGTNGTIISSTRHYEALVRADEAIVRVQQGMMAGVSGEFLSMDLQDCLAALGEITGEITNEEVLSNIFSKFCIGK